MPKVVALDSSVILAFLRREANRSSIIEAALLAAAEKPDEFQFYASVLTVSEIAYFEDQPELSEADIQLIDEFWDNAPIMLVESNLLIARRARDLFRGRARSAINPQLPKLRKRTLDVLHLATALWLKTDEFWTYDVQDFQKYDSVGVTVCQPYIDQLSLEI